MAENNNSSGDAEMARSPAISYQALLDLETNPVPESLRENSNTFLGSGALSTDRYLSADYYQREKANLWSRVWQVVCRETEIARPGDFYTHEIADKSIFVCVPNPCRLKVTLMLVYIAAGS